MVHDCLNSLSELLDVGIEFTEDALAPIGPEVDTNSSKPHPWRRLQILNCSRNTIPAFDKSMVSE